MSQRNCDSEHVWDAVGTIRALTASATPFCRVCLRVAPDVKLVPACSVAALSGLLKLISLWTVS